MICGKAILLLWLFQFGYGQIKNPGIEISLGARGLDLGKLQTRGNFFVITKKIAFYLKRIFTI